MFIEKYSYIIYSFAFIPLYDEAYSFNFVKLQVKVLSIGNYY